MNCRKVLTSLPLLCYSELRKKDLKALSDHIAGCTKCRKAHADYKKTFDLLSRWPEQPVAQRIFPGILEHTKPEILTPDELAVYLRVPAGEILADIDTIPHFKIGKYIRFHRDTIIRWIVEKGGLKVTEPLDELTEWKYLVNRAQNN